MSITGTAASRSLRVRSTRIERRWVRLQQPIWPFVWRGLLPALGLFAVAIYAFWPFARGDIEAAVRDETRHGLDAAGFGWVDLDVSGQQVHLSGQQPEAGAGDRALAVARSTTCPAWGTRWVCPIDVSGDFTASPAPASITLAPVAEPSADAIEACETALARLVAASKIEFATGSAAIAPSSDALLDALGNEAAGCPGTLRIEGHTDSTGKPDENKLLSQARADAVRAALVKRGIGADRLIAVGFGAENPIADNATEEGRAQNRRIEFRVDRAANP